MAPAPAIDGAGAYQLSETTLMNRRLLRLIGVLLSLIYISATADAQKKPIPEQPAPKSADAESRSLRKQQLRIFHENLLSRTLDNIKKMDEPALRLSARNHLLAYLWESKTLSDKHLGLKRNLALDAISDLSNHHRELPHFMLDYLSADLAALIAKYQPDLTEKLQLVKETATSRQQAINIRSLFELKNGDLLAAAKIRETLAHGDDVKELHFWLEDLRKQKSREFEPLLHEVIAIAERGPQISFETLMWLNPVYFQPEVPRPLQKSFAAMIFTRTQPGNFVGAPASQTAYELLNRALPHIQRLLPEIYEQAMNQSLVLRAAINQTQLADEERSKRLRDSLNPIEDLVREAEGTKTKSERNALLAEAAEMALRKKEFSMCLDIVAKLDLEMTDPRQVGFWRNWSSQFLKKLVTNAAAAKKLEIAEQAALKMTTSLVKVQAVALIMRHWRESGDKTSAHRLLVEATKIAESISEEFEKAQAFLLLSIRCDPVDESKKPQLLLSSIKALNSSNKPTTERDQQPYQEYLRNLDNTAYLVARGFRDLTTKDENVAMSLMDQVYKSDLRTFALIGILSGLDDLLAKGGD